MSLLIRWNTLRMKSPFRFQKDHLTRPTRLSRLQSTSSRAYNQRPILAHPRWSLPRKNGWFSKLTKSQTPSPKRQDQMKIQMSIQLTKLVKNKYRQTRIIKSLLKLSKTNQSQLQCSPVLNFLNHKMRWRKNLSSNQSQEFRDCQMTILQPHLNLISWLITQTSKLKNKMLQKSQRMRLKPACNRQKPNCPKRNPRQKVLSSMMHPRLRNSRPLKRRNHKHKSPLTKKKIWRLIILVLKMSPTRMKPSDKRQSMISWVDHLK